MKQLIMDLLDLTRIKFEKSQKSLQNVDLCEMAKYVVDMANPVAIQKDVTIEIKVEGKVVYPSNPEDMEMIFNNLITNAIKYNKEGGKVICRLTEDDRQVKISVRDTGIGMNEDEVSKLFNEFVRIKNERTRHIQGTGLGLSIVKKISQLYEGSVTVESMKNVGSTFTVTLPKTEETNGSQ
jgi:signal transduction histidine kinase